MNTQVNHRLPRKTKDYIFFAVTAILVLFFAALTVYFFMHPSFYIVDSAKGLQMFCKKRLLGEFAMAAATAALFFCRRKIRHLIKGHVQKLSALLMILTPFFTFASVFLITRSTPKNFNPKNYASLSLSPLVLFCNIVIISMILLFFVVLTNNMALSSALCYLVCIVFSIIDYFICRFRGNPILASDLSSAGTALDVAGNYSFIPNFQIIFFLQSAVLLLYIACYLTPSPLVSGGRKRLVFSASSVAVLAVFIYTFFASSCLTDIGLALNGFKPSVTYHRYGGLLTFVYSFQATLIGKPDGYSLAKMDELAEKYPSDSAANAKELPNIIVIIDEAFSDPGVIADLNASEDYLPFWHSIEDDCIHGYTYASVLGGSTANTEFEVLTGNSTVLLPKNCIAFQVYFKDKMSSLVSNCAAMGYEELTAIHPYSKKNYNRMKVYPFLGFQGFISGPDFPEGVQKLRRYIADSAVMKMIIDRYETAKAKTDDPFFIYAMTMQNHGSYGKAYDNMPTTITLPKYPDKTAEQYVNLVKCTDDALQELIAYFSKVEEPTVIMFLGDHQPSLPDEFLDAVTEGAYNNWSPEDMMKQYAIPFIIWSNYGLPAKEYEKTSMNYLQSILYESCRLPMTGYQKYLSELSEKIPAITANGYWGADGNFYLPEDSSSPYYEDLLQYQQILYNNIIDYKKRPENFYELAG